MTYGNCDVVGHRFARKTLPSWSVLSQTVFMRQETDYKLPSNSRWMHKSGESVASLDLGSVSEWLRLPVGQVPFYRIKKSAPLLVRLLLRHCLE